MKATSISDRRGTHQLRSGRSSIANQIYHISTATIARQPIFLNLDAGRAVVNALQREQDIHRVGTLAYVVMPDHLHWLFRLPGKRGLSISVNNVKSLSARSINQLLARKGQVWQKGFYDRAIRSNEDVVSVARYIIANPLRSGIVSDVRRYSLWDAVWVDSECRLD